MLALLWCWSRAGTSLDLWHFRTGFTLMTWATFLGLGAAALGILLLLIPRTRRGHGKALVVSVVLGLAAAAMPLLGAYTAKSVPFIHDISTDTTRPPEFVAILPLRAEAPNRNLRRPDRWAQRRAIPIYIPCRSIWHVVHSPARKVRRDMGGKSRQRRGGALEATTPVLVRLQGHRHPHRAEAAASRMTSVRFRVGKSDVGK